MNERSFTEGARRAIARAEQLAADRSAPFAQPGHLLWALMAEESHAFNVLMTHGLTQQSVPLDDILLPRTSKTQSFDEPPVDSDGLSTDEIVDRLSLEMREIFERADRSTLSSGEPEKRDSDLRLVLREAQSRARATDHSTEVSTEHLLAALRAVPSVVQDLLAEHGVPELKSAQRAAEVLAEPVDAPFEIAWRDPLEADRTNTYRIMDAAANRAREGVRVVEDFVRFTLDDAFLSRQLKELRHSMSVGLRCLDESLLIHARDTQGDVGTTIHTHSELSRQSLLDVARANLKRVEEATRTLEEFAKVAATFDVSDTALRDLPQQMGRVRYDLYTLEKAILTTVDSRRRLDGANLYLLLTQSNCQNGWREVLTQAIAGGVRVIQIREKEMSDRELLDHARRVREVTLATNTLLIINDRPDLAVLSDADGVHVGQEELTVRDVRKIVGPHRLIGVSTHSIDQARQAVLDGANYLGVGPTFPSGTKSFTEFAGLDYVRSVAMEISLPWFAIGGIDVGNLPQVISAGTRRIAVSGAVCRHQQPQLVASQLAEMLNDATSKNRNAR